MMVFVVNKDDSWLNNAGGDFGVRLSPPGAGMVADIGNATREEM